MLWRALLSMVVIVGLAGCATSRQKMRSDDLQVRLEEAEKEAALKEQEVDDLKAEIRSLSGELRTSKSYGADSTVASSGKYSDIIRVSASPSDIQKALKDAGYYTGNVDGKIGAKTRKAIKEFQSANGLNPDGVVGKKTWAKLQGSAQ